jgi:RND family efflux transporter MFP subunit
LKTLNTPSGTDDMPNAKPLAPFRLLLTAVSRVNWIATAVVVAAGLAATWMARAADSKPASESKAASKPSLTVTLTQAQRADLAVTVAANGNIAPWQEAIVGAESNGWRLAEVRVNVGDVVKRGQLLATFTADLANAELAQSKASVAEAEANAADAAANAARARELQTTGALSAQQINQYLTVERTAQARLDALRASAKVQQLRLAQTQVLAPDAGVISSRSATVGAVVPAGSELFRLIRQSRLEWRAEVPASDLGTIQPGMAVRVTTAGGSTVAGTVRMVAPTVDAATRNGLVYVDLPAALKGGARAGMFARGEFDIARSSAMTLPQTAVLLRDGFSYVFRLAPDNKVQQVQVQVGRRVGDRIEITQGLDANAKVVAAGAGFLGDGDTVRVVEAAAAAPAKTASAK